MKTVFMIDGGAGRAICAIPALEKYVKDHPHDTIVILVYGWDALFWGNLLLQSLTFNTNDKGTFEKHILDADQVISPEPYRLPQYFKQQVSLVEAFDILINGENNELSYPKLYLSANEKLGAMRLIADCKKHQKKEKTIVIQPFGSAARFESLEGHDEVFDSSCRSMNLLMYSSLVKSLSDEYNLILFAEPIFHFKQDIYTYKFNGDLRSFAAIISQADYFLGCDSVGQHFARATDTPGTVVFGSTFPVNVSYPDWFQIVDTNKEKVYSPLRIYDIDCNLADRLNTDCMNYSKREIENIAELIKLHIKKMSN